MLPFAWTKMTLRKSRQLAGHEDLHGREDSEPGPTRKHSTQPVLGFPASPCSMACLSGYMLPNFPI